MEDFTKIIVLISGLWMITWSLALNAKNIQSAIVFKVIPFFLGLGLILVFLNMIGLVN